MFILTTTHRYAFELADSVSMPFTGYLDAEVGIAKAASQLLASTILKALSVRTSGDLSAHVAEWMPVMESALPDDERLILFSEASKTLPCEMANASYDGYFNRQIENPRVGGSILPPGHHFGQQSIGALRAVSHIALACDAAFLKKISGAMGKRARHIMCRALLGAEITF